MTNQQKTFSGNHTFVKFWLKYLSCFFKEFAYSLFGFSCLFFFVYFESQWRHESRFRCRILILYPALYFISRMAHSYYIQPVRSSRQNCTKVWLPGKYCSSSPTHFYWNCSRILPWIILTYWNTLKGLSIKFKEFCRDFELEPSQDWQNIHRYSIQIHIIVAQCDIL